MEYANALPGVNAFIAKGRGAVNMSLTQMAFKYAATLAFSSYAVLAANDAYASGLLQLVPHAVSQGILLSIGSGSKKREESADDAELRRRNWEIYANLLINPTNDLSISGWEASEKYRPYLDECRSEINLGGKYKTLSEAWPHAGEFIGCVQERDYAISIATYSAKDLEIYDDGSTYPEKIRACQKENNIEGGNSLRVTYAQAQNYKRCFDKKIHDEKVMEGILWGGGVLATTLVMLGGAFFERRRPS